MTETPVQRCQFYPPGNERRRRMNEARKSSSCLLSPGTRKSYGQATGCALSDNRDIPLLCSDANNGSHGSGFVPNNSQPPSLSANTLCATINQKNRWSGAGVLGPVNAIKYADWLCLKVECASNKTNKLPKNVICIYQYSRCIRSRKD